MAIIGSRAGDAAALIPSRDAPDESQTGMIICFSLPSRKTAARCELKADAGLLRKSGAFWDRERTVWRGGVSVLLFARMPQAVRRDRSAAHRFFCKIRQNRNVMLRFYAKVKDYQ